MSGIAAIWCAVLALGAAAAAVTRPSPAHALLWLVATLIALAGAFFALGAGFAAALQILIYAGAITVVFVFAATTVDVSDAALAEERRRIRAAWRAPAIAAGLVVLPFALGFAAPPEGAAAAVSARSLGLLLFGEWAAAVELASFLLLAGALAVRHLARERLEDGE
jgi:NADH:ubiquinone oxidoreductase subunit 6 (chain J)